MQLWQWIGATLTLAWPDQIYVTMGIMMGAAAVVCAIALAGDKLMPYIEPHLLKLKERYIKPHLLKVNLPGGDHRRPLGRAVCKPFPPRPTLAS